MSKFEDYEKVSKVYDKERVASGADVIAGLLHVYGNRPLRDLHLLDAGCGTGNYAKALIDYGVGKVTLLDGSEGMLNVAKDKLKDAIDEKVVDQAVLAKMPTLPFADGKYDAVLFSLVLHHLEEVANGEEFPATEQTLQEAKRILRPGGIMFIITLLPSIYKESIWFSQLNHTLTDRFCKRFPSAEQYLAMFEKYGFSCVSKSNILGFESRDNYTDPDGPLKEAWRNGGSYFALATEQELADIKQFVQIEKDKGTMLKFIKEHDRSLEIGSLTLFTCVAS